MIEDIIKKFNDYKLRTPRSVLQEMEAAQLYQDKRYILLYEEEYIELKDFILQEIEDYMEIEIKRFLVLIGAALILLMLSLI